ncbi:mitotic-spindle organizing protein 2-like isoform X2 [Babylonia areolata]
MLGKEKSEVLRFQIRSKDVLAPDEMELFELTQLAGVTMDPSIFKIILDLLKVNVAPMAITQMLRLMCDPQQQRVTADVHSFLSTSSDSLSLSSQRSSSRQRTSGGSGIGKGRQIVGSSRLRDSRH